jgi:hypothetical protein
MGIFDSIRAITKFDKSARQPFTPGAECFLPVISWRAGDRRLEANTCSPYTFARLVSVTLIVAQRAQMEHHEEPSTRETGMLLMSLSFWSASSQPHRN